MEMVMNFRKKSREEEMYNRIKRRLIKKGYKHVSTTTQFSLSFREERYPYHIKLTYKKSA